MLSIPLAAVPSQQITVTLEQQVCQIKVYQRGNDPPIYGVFLDLFVNNELIIRGVLCQNNNRIVRSRYLGFSGDLFFHDTEGSENPLYAGIGSRYQLIYITQAELDGAG